MVSRSGIGLLCTIVIAVVSLFAATGTAAAAGTIEGEVVDAATEVGIEEVEVCPYQLPEFEAFTCHLTNADGEYALGGLPDGEYIVEFWASSLGYAPQFFDGVSSFENASEVIVSGGTVSGIDAELEEGGAIEGRVTDASTGAGIEEAEVCAYSQVIAGNCASTDSDGNYSIIGLATGSYLVEFWAEFLGYETLFYDQQSDPEKVGFNVGVTAPDATVAIDARLSKPGSGVIVTPPPPTVVPPPAPPISKTITKPRRKALKCRKGFKKVKRHGRKVCIKKHKKHKKRKKHRS